MPGGSSQLIADLKVSTIAIAAIEAAMLVLRLAAQHMERCEEVVDSGKVNRCAGIQ